MSRVAVIQYPGSNCDLDALEVLQKVEKTKAELVWHKDLKADDYDAYVLPGGFSYGDYLRAGAIAATSPSLKIIREAVEQNKPVLGICNGLQILVEPVESRNHSNALHHSSPERTDAKDPDRSQRGTILS